MTDAIRYARLLASTGLNAQSAKFAIAVLPELLDVLEAAQSHTKLAFPIDANVAGAQERLDAALLAALAALERELPEVPPLDQVRGILKDDAP